MGPKINLNRRIAQNEILSDQDILCLENLFLSKPSAAERHEMSDWTPAMNTSRDTTGIQQPTHSLKLQLYLSQIRQP